MKYIITTDNEILGAFDSVEELEDRYVINGSAHMQYSVIGRGVISEVSDDYKTPEQLVKEEELRVKRIEQDNEMQKKNRNFAYVLESDPLFFKYQRDEITKDEWLAKVEEIKQRYPYQ